MNIPEAEKDARTYKPVVGKFTENPRLEEMHSARSRKIYYIYIFCALVFADQFNIRCRRSGVSQQQNGEHFPRLEIQLYIVLDPWFQSQILRSVYTEARVP